LASGRLLTEAATDVRILEAFDSVVNELDASTHTGLASALEPSSKVTVPVGVPPFGSAEVTVAVNVTSSPKVESPGAGDSLTPEFFFL
jgi:hypothetical protein